MNYFTFLLMMALFHLRFALRRFLPAKIFIACLLLFCFSQISWEIIKSRPLLNFIKMSRMIDVDATADDFKWRHSYLQQKCQEFAPNDTYEHLCNHLQQNTALKLSWCYVPKAGCTFWKKIFYALQESAKGDSNVDIRRMGFRQTHTAPIKNMCYSRQPEEIANHVSTHKTLLVTRDPYTRLFSAYVDKFFLPDHWREVGTHIIKNFRKNVTQRSKHCGHDVSFKEFINYVIHVGKNGGGVSWFCDDHWQPVSKICLPCKIPYDFISKQETFSRDRDFLLEEFKINKHLDLRFSRDMIQETISERIEAYWITGLRTGCVSQHFLLRRLWTAFQIQGYLPYNETLHSNLPIQAALMTRKQFTETVLSVFQRYRHMDLRKQRTQAFIKAYTGLTIQQMRELQNIYELDFELFGYNKEPKELYSFFVVAK